MLMASETSERQELAKLCSCRDWSKAIRILNSLLSQSCAIQDICNRAFCYSKLELHKHVVKDCDKALQLDPTLLQAYILKGRALSALGKKEDALLVWEQGYGYAVHQSADLKLFLELEELLKQNRKVGCENHAMESPESSISVSEPALHVDEKLNSAHKNHSKLNDDSELCSELSDTSENRSKAFDTSDGHDELRDTVNGSKKLNSESNGAYTSNGDDELRDTVNGNKKLNSESNGTYTSDGHDELRDTVNENKKLNSESNGTYDTFNKSSDESELCSELSDTSEQSSKSSVIHSKPSDISEVLWKSSNKYGIHSELGYEANRNKKFCVTRISKTKSISVDFRLSRGIAQVNEGNYSTAISIFDQILKEEPTYPEALVGRGTAYAFQRELGSAIADFTKAIESNSSACEAWKRRGQARAALGESVEAIADLTKALEFEPNSADILHERGIVNFKFKDFNAAVEDLSACVQLDKENKSAYTYLGLALSSIGEYRKAEEAHMNSIELDQNFLEGWAHLTQFYQDLANATKALECIERVLEIDVGFAKAYHLRGLLRHGMGEHKKAIMDLSIGLGIENSNIECLYLRASCYHAIGEYGEAIKDYDKALKLELDSMEKFVLQCLAFYQKELALYAASKINSEFSSFDIDNDINPLFKEYWCKRFHPQHVSENVFRQPSLKRSRPRKLDFSVTKQKTALLQAADSIGRKIQYNCPGFLPNRRQHRMAGLAAIEIAQKVSRAWRSLQVERNRNTSKHGKKARRKEKINTPSQNRGGACCTTSSSSETSNSYTITEDRSSCRSMMSWHDLYSLAVKWRQISEPCDPVVWVNKLSEEFNSGFGSHTPLILGQAKVVRYFPNYQRALDVAKIVIKEKKYVHNKADDIMDLSEDGKIQEIMHAESCSDLYRIVGEDFWLATWCNSTAFEGKQLEGTRITLLKMGEHGFDFAIRTPCTPSRWEDFDREMAVAWEALCNAYSGEAYGSTNFDMLEKVREAILRMTYYWYNFMPLSRGTAVVGFVVLLGLFLAANMKFIGSIPKDLQVDWEAILNFDPNSFMDSVKSWLYPSLKVTTTWKEYPDVASTFSTTGSVVAALSSYDD